MNAIDVLTLLRSQRDVLDTAIRELEKPAPRNDDGYYSSLNLPPDIQTRERFAKLARHIPGATVAGRQRRAALSAGAVSL